MTKKEKKNIKLEFTEKNLLLVLCSKICTALITLTIICVIGAVVANSYDDKVFSPQFQQTGGYVFVDYIFSKLLYGIFGNWSTKFYVITFLLMFVLIVLKIMLKTLYGIKWKNFINAKSNPTPAVSSNAANTVNTVANAPTYNTQSNVAPAQQPNIHKANAEKAQSVPVQVSPVAAPNAQVTANAEAAKDVQVPANAVATSNSSDNAANEQ